MTANDETNYSNACAALTKESRRAMQMARLILGPRGAETIAGYVEAEAPRLGFDV